MSNIDLERVAREYHANSKVSDKHIEDLSQHFCGEWMLRSLGGARRVLEMGYGEGIITGLLLQNGRQVTLVEGSAVLHEEIRRNLGDKVEAIHSLFEEYVPSQPFEAIIASHILEHVDHPVALLKKMRGWVAPGGKLIVVVPNKESLHRRLAVIMGLQPELDTLSARDKLVGHQRVYSHATLERDLNAAGFKVMETTGFFLKLLPNSMMLGYSPELLAAMNQISGDLPKELLANVGVVAQ